MRPLLRRLCRLLILLGAPLLTAAGAVVIWQHLDQPITAVRVQELRSGLYALSWPRRVSLRRHWPGQLHIELHKEMVVAAWGEAAYLTTAAKVVELADAASGLPTLQCAQAEPQRAMEVYQMLEERASRAGLSPSRLSENLLGEWTLELSDGTRVVLGRDQLALRMDRFVRDLQTGAVWVNAYRRALCERRRGTLAARRGDGAAPGGGYGAHR